MNDSRKYSRSIVHNCVVKIRISEFFFWRNVSLHFVQWKLWNSRKRLRVVRRVSELYMIKSYASLGLITGCGHITSRLKTSERSTSNDGRKKCWSALNFWIRRPVKGSSMSSIGYPNWIGVVIWNSILATERSRVEDCDSEAHYDRWTYVTCL